MRPLAMVTAVAGAALVTACADRPAERPMGASPPTVTYNYIDSDDHDDVADEADDHCAARYDADAVLLERSVDDGRYQATFACE